MNPNYNLMRLANLYGGMNKYAAADFSTMTVKPGGAEHQKLIEMVNNGSLSKEDLDLILGGGQITPGSAAHQALVGLLPKTAPADAKELESRIAANNAMLANVKGPGILDKSMAWIKENPILAGGIGAGALGLGGLGAYALMKDDEEEEGRKKSAGYIDPYVAQVLAHDYITKMASANGLPTVAAGVTGLSNYLNLR